MGLNFHSVAQFAEAFLFRCGNQNHLGIQAFGQVEIDPRGVAGLARRHHAFDDHHVFACSRLLIEADDFFQQFIQLAVTEHALDMRQSQRFGRVQAMGACDQLAGTLGAHVALMRLGDGFEKADLEAGTLQGTDQTQADRGQADTETGGGNKESVHSRSVVVR